jgi:RNA polymerase sigma-70 factor (ECF subfamily)
MHRLNRSNGQAATRHRRSSYLLPRTRVNERQRRKPEQPTRGPADIPGKAEYLTPMQELQLVEAWREGDADALRRLLSSYQRRVFTICYRMLHNVDDAQEIAQDVLLKVFESLETYDGRSKLSTWIIRITMNACVSFMRRAQVRQTSSLHGSPHDSDESSSRGLRLALEDATEPEPGSRVEHDELRRSVIIALNRLDPDVRALLVLRDVQDLDYEQIAQVLGVPVGTVKSRLFRARAALREEMEREG